jgi:hypothetical protein
MGPLRAEKGVSMCRNELEGKERAADGLPRLDRNPLSYTDFA